jgi:hypothetical protein
MAHNEDKKIKTLLTKANSIFNQITRSTSAGVYSTYELYEALGYPINISYADYLQKFRRQDIANRIVKAPVQGTWRDKPKIYESNDTDTKFEEDLDKLLVDLKLYSVFYKLDLMATLGRYAVLFLGLDDESDPAIEATKAKELLYVTPIPEDRASIETWVTNQKSPRFGQPLTYSVTVNQHVSSITSISNATTVNYSRLIHVAENTLDSDVYGVPSLEPVYNRLLGLDKLAGGSPEMYWRGARPGYTATANEGTIVTPDQKEALREQLSDFVNNLQRWLYVQGMDITALSPQVVTPEPHVAVQLKLISAATRIPLRVLVGSERGELASTQDERAWLTYLEERRVSVAENLIVRPFVDRMISLGVISPPVTGEYFIKWEPLVILSEKEKAEITKIKTDSLKTYLESMGGPDIIPIETFLDMMGFTEEEIELMLTVAGETIKEEDALRTPKTNENPSGRET